MTTTTTGSGELLVALHDVTPAHADRLVRAETLLASLGVPSVAYLLVPDYHGRGPANEDRDFVAWCRASRPFNVEWLLHGYFHREDDRHPRNASISEWWRRTFMTKGEGEFLALRGRGLEDRLRRGVEVFQQCLDTRPWAFVAPAWLYNEELLPVLARLDIAITESHFHVFDVARDRARHAPVITWASRSVVHRNGSIAMAAARRRPLGRDPLVRVAMHPGDFDHPALVDSISRTIDTLRDGRRVAGYAELR